ncbi:alpha/beta hydrolase [Sciscionella marina]|uniref:alpha/beta hydrolase n=1 Tax=Sciscionella marina TaxID=508770 RepID=UPI0009FE3225|nr:alpha/beta hydrolase [Sciscionella marina]
MKTTGKQHQTPGMRWIIATFLTFLGVMLAGVTPSTAAPAQKVMRCQAQMIPVDYGGQTIQVYGRYCAPPGGGSRVVLAVHGATYSGEYFTGLGTSPDAQRELASRGLASLVIDRPGHGRSTHLSSLGLTIDRQAVALHQILQSLRNGHFNGGDRPRQVTLMGHSLGSALSVVTAAKYPHDMDRLVLTGWSDMISPDTLINLLLTKLGPAVLDQQLRPIVGLDVGALTTQPGARARLFGSPDETARTKTADEAHKDWVGITEVLTGVTEGISTAHTHEIQVPTLVVNGSKDDIFCAGLLQHSCSSSSALQKALAPSFSRKLTAVSLPGYGHSLQMSPHAAGSINTVSQWLNNRNPQPVGR